MADTKVRGFRLDDETFSQLQKQAERLGLDTTGYLKMLIKFDFSRAIEKKIQDVAKGE